MGIPKHSFVGVYFYNVKNNAAKVRFFQWNATKKQ